MQRNQVVDLASDVPAVTGRRRFLALFGAGAAAAAMPGVVSGDQRDLHAPVRHEEPDWVFEDPPVVLDQDPSRVLLDQNENPIAPSAVERQAMQEALDLANRYPDSEGALIRELASLHGVDRDCLLMGCGSTELLKVCADAYLKPHSELLQAAPTYPTIERYGRVNAADIVSVPVDSRGEVDMGEMGRRLGPRTAVAYLCNPNNPTGTVIPDGQVQDFLESVPEGVLTVCDEAYHHYVTDNRYRSLIEMASRRWNLVVLRTFSKAYGLAGMRIGYAVAHPETIRALSPHRLSINLNNPGIHAAIAALKDQAFVDETVRLNAESRGAIQREMPRFGGRPVPSQAGFVWVAFDRETRPIREALAAEHVYVRMYSHSPKHLRISTGRPQDMDRLFGAMEKVLAS